MCVGIQVLSLVLKMLTNQLESFLDLAQRWFQRPYVLWKYLHEIVIFGGFFKVVSISSTLWACIWAKPKSFFKRWLSWVGLSPFLPFFWMFKILKVVLLLIYPVYIYIINIVWRPYKMHTVEANSTFQVILSIRAYICLFIGLHFLENKGSAVNVLWAHS